MKFAQKCAAAACAITMLMAAGSKIADARAMYPGPRVIEGSIFALTLGDRWDHLQTHFLGDGGFYAGDGATPGAGWVNYTMSFSLRAEVVFLNMDGSIIGITSVPILALRSSDDWSGYPDMPLEDSYIEEDSDRNSQNEEPPVAKDYNGYLNIDSDVIIPAQMELGILTTMPVDYKVHWRYYGTCSVYDEHNGEFEEKTYMSGLQIDSFRAQNNPRPKP